MAKDKRVANHESANSDLSEIDDLKRQFQQRLPPQRPPVILVCGKTGSGKSSTINTLLGKKVAKVGHKSTGTTQAGTYYWKVETENITIKDLPGLGDSPKKERGFKEIYQQQARNADGCLVVVNPPRAADGATIEIVSLLLSCGILANQIVFGFNWLSNLTYKKNGNDKQVELDGLIGPIKKSDRMAIADAKKAFLAELQAEFPYSQAAFPQGYFSIEQIVEYDSRTGWNIHSLFFSVVKALPYETFAKMRKVMDDAHNRAKKREELRLKKEKKEIERMKKKLEKAEDKQKRMKHENNIRHKEEKRKHGELKKKLDLLADKMRRAEERERAIDKFDEAKKKVTSSLLEEVTKKAVEIVGNVIVRAAEWVPQILKGIFLSAS